MFKKQALVDTLNQTYYGYGVFLEKSEAGNVIAHSGGWPGYTTYLLRNVDKDQTCIVLSNNEALSLFIAKALQYIHNDLLIVMPYSHKAIKMDSLMMEKFVGSYQSTLNISSEMPPNEISIVRKGDKLFIVIPRWQRMELKPESSTKFFFADGSDFQLEFELNDSNEVTKAWFINYGVKKEYKPMP